MNRSTLAQWQEQTAIAAGLVPPSQRRSKTYRASARPKFHWLLRAAMSILPRARSPQPLRPLRCPCGRVNAEFRSPLGKWLMRQSHALAQFPDPRRCSSLPLSVGVVAVPTVADAGGVASLSGESPAVCTICDARLNDTSIRACRLRDCPNAQKDAA